MPRWDGGEDVSAAVYAERLGAEHDVIFARTGEAAAATLIGWSSQQQPYGGRSHTNVLYEHENTTHTRVCVCGYVCGCVSRGDQSNHWFQLLLFSSYSDYKPHQITTINFVKIIFTILESNPLRALARAPLTGR